MKYYNKRKGKKWPHINKRITYTFYNHNDVIIFYLYNVFIKVGCIIKFNEWNTKINEK